MVSNYFKQAGSSNDTAVPSTSRASAGAYVPDVEPEYDNDYDFEEASVVEPGRALNVNDIFRNHDNNEKFIIIPDNQAFELPKIFEDQTKYSAAVSDSTAEFVNMACTSKADVSKFLEEKQIPVNFKSITPPLINPEIYGAVCTPISNRGIEVCRKCRKLLECLLFH